MPQEEVESVAGIPLLAWKDGLQFIKLILSLELCCVLADTQSQANGIRFRTEKVILVCPQSPQLNLELP